MSTQTFQEHQHPRGQGGQFATKPADESSTGLAPAATPSDQEVMKGVLADFGIDPDCIHSEEHGVSIQPSSESGMAIYIERGDSGYTVTEKSWGGVGPDSYDEEDELYQGENLDAAMDAAWERTDQAIDHGWPVLAKQAPTAPDPVWGLQSSTDTDDYDPPPF